MSQLIRTSSAGSVLEITLNRPDVLNSFNAQMGRELREALDAAQADKAIRAVLVTGAGRAFCAGQDLSEVPPPSEDETPDLRATVRGTWNPVVRRIRTLEKPVVCAVNGVAAGAGANLALACDIVLASDKAAFIQSFGRIGLIPDTGGTFFLPRIAGLPRATAMMLLGEKISAERAFGMGMIYRVCTGESLMDEARQVASELAALPTRALGLTKRALNASLGADLDTQLELEEELQGEAGRSRDFAEGVRAFLEKRPPQFIGE